jgi:hypothetical protein
VTERFFLGYDECRARFLALAHGARAHVERHWIDARGPEDQRLSIDVARFGAAPGRARRVLVALSGTHGIEGFAGSAIQQHFLAERLAELPIPEDGALLVIHALNPWGMAYWRRANEHNVDLNRNFVDFSAALPRRPEYAALHPLLCPAQLDEAGEKAFLEAAHRLVAEHGLAWLTRVISEGHHEFAEGLYYGGDSPEASNRIARALFRTHVGGAHEALLVDLHTGFGPFGACTLLSGHRADTPEHAFLAACFAGERIEVTQDVSDPATPHKYGQLAAGVATEVPGVGLRAVTMELGTHPDERILLAERRENWLHHHGERDTAQGRAIAWEHRECSCPDSDAWRSRALAHGVRILAAGWRGLFAT